MSALPVIPGPVVLFLVVPLGAVALVALLSGLDLVAARLLAWRRRRSQPRPGGTRARAPLSVTRREERLPRRPG